MTVDECMRGERVVGLPRRFESLHLALAAACRAMRVFRAIVQISALSMFYIWKQLALSHAVASQLIGYDHAWHILKARVSRVYLNNRGENSYRPTRRRERQMQRFKSPDQANDFLSAHAFIYGHFHPRRHLLAASTYRALRTEAFNVWQRDTCVRNAA